METENNNTMMVTGTNGFPEGVTIQRDGMYFDKSKVGIDELIKTTEILNAAYHRKDGERRLIQWCIADALNYGETAFGEKYSQAINETGMDYGYLRELCYIASRIEQKRRHPELSISHHKAVLKLPPRLQDKMLAEAEKENISQKDLLAKVREMTGEEPKKKQKSTVKIEKVKNFITEEEALNVTIAVVEWIKDWERDNNPKELPNDRLKAWAMNLKELRAFGRRMGVMA